jgi:hypothetical protein
MAFLSGSLAGIELHSVFQLLAATRQTGSLSVSHGRWSARVEFDRGRPVGASFGDAAGLAALEALALALPNAAFTFSANGPRGAHDLVGEPETITAFLERLRVLRQRLGLPKHLLDAIPVRVEPAGPQAGDERVAIERQLLLTLAAADGRRTVETIATLRGTADVVVDIAALVERGLLRLKPPRSAVHRWLAREARTWLRPAALAVVAVSLLIGNAWKAPPSPPDPAPAAAAGTPTEVGGYDCDECLMASVRAPNMAP